MDFIQDWTSLLTQYSPSYLRSFYSFTATLRAYLLPLFNRVTTSPDLASIALLIIILFFSLKILDMAWRAVLFWVKLAARMVFWGALVLGSLYVWNRGVDGTVDDAQELALYWADQYAYYQQQAEMARKLGAQGGGGGGGGGGYARKRREGWR